MYTIVIGAIFLGFVTAIGWSAIELVVRHSVELNHIPKIVAWSAVGWFVVAWAMAAL